MSSTGDLTEHRAWRFEGGAPAEDACRARASDDRPLRSPSAPCIERTATVARPGSLTLRAPPELVARAACRDLAALRRTLTFIAAASTVAALALRGHRWLSAPSAILLEGLAVLTLLAGLGVITWELVWRRRRAAAEAGAPRRSPPSLS